MALRTYIAGPMRGIPRYNFPAFDAAAAQLRAMGLDIINPAELDIPIRCRLISFATP